MVHKGTIKFPPVVHRRLSHCCRVNASLLALPDISYRAATRPCCKTYTAKQVLRLPAVSRFVGCLLPARTVQASKYVTSGGNSSVNLPGTLP
ncbi:MAG: hypothetical protein RL748_2879 [Pseudomonadota bacterium]|jgi:hypothetical protein